MSLNTLPNDPVMLLSVVNTKLRDQYQSLGLLCEDLQIEPKSIHEKLNQIDYFYDIDTNQYI